MRLPEFTSEQSLGKAAGQYRTQASAGSTYRGLVQPQAQCFCSEPDFQRVCTSPGHCYNKQICLQWFCPSRGQEVDEDYFGDLGQTVHNP